ncbi:GGDEF domain-containing protein [Planktothrix paucivesiculata]|uniref:Diguanylate cyclase n=1 Tax=Planktothrix paucivesiculata PCC 9631 TaxID=671071 RepID=A0A7Z9BFN9_9CYAN|nr:GGDEF domain-containing protein [Planktothrix paucivesiculata]VXD11952.1 putative diguanylate cyclase [Planktothrix paucivesiculata PCC 9631]
MENDQLSQKQLLDYISQLCRDIETLKQEKADLETLLEVIIDHGDSVEAQLQESHKKLKAEIQQRYLTQLKLQASQEHLQSLVTLLSQEKNDLELILETTIEHSNIVEESLHYDSIHDPLTGLLNRRYLDLVLPQVFTSAQKIQECLSILIADIDYFKLFNDNFGHKAGDVVLKLVSQAVQGVMRTSDLAYRYGGEELVFVLPNTDVETATIIAEEIRQKIKNLQYEYSYNFLTRITVSIGVAAFPEHTTSCEDLLQLADRALYQAKAQGRDRVVVIDHNANHQF